MTSKAFFAPKLPIGGLSHVQGDQGPALLDMTIPEVFKATVKRFPDGQAAVFSSTGKRWTWTELDRRIDDLASGLTTLGLTSGDRIGMWGPNSPEWLLMQYATARVGLIMVNVNPAYRTSELEYALNKSGCRAIVLMEAFKASNYVAMMQEVLPELSNGAVTGKRFAKLPDMELVIKTGAAKVPGMMLFNDIVRSGIDRGLSHLDALTNALNPDDPINIQFTSGTTGLPKGATLTHRNIVNNAHFTVSTMAFKPADKLCLPVPLYHCFGMVLGSLGCVTAGSCLVFPGEGFDPKATLAALATEKCTAVYGVPSMFALMLDQPEFPSLDLSSLRTGVMAGAPCPIELMKRVIADMNMRDVTICYGMTETSPTSFQSSPADTLERRVSTLGQVHPHVEAKIVDTDGNILPIGTPGEICTRGYLIMKGYWDDDAKTADAIRDGWMHTGDLGVIDENGYCSIVGRLKDMVIRGGENIYPREVEEFLGQHEKVREVQVFGIPDPTYGEELCAWIVCRDGQTLTEDDVRAFCQGRISHFKIPKHIRFKQELPLTVTGKAQKFKMRDEMAAELKQRANSKE